MRTREEQISALACCLYGQDMTTNRETAERMLQEAEHRVRAQIARDIEKACDTVMGIETPMMRGDNLAVTLCSYFEDMAGEPDDNGWHPKAIEGHDQVHRAIKRHFLKAIDAAREVG